MASRDDIVIEITPQVLLKAYACGIFPMAESADDPALYWIEPQQRGILPLERVRREVRFHYQWVVLNDFLPTLVSDQVLKEVLPPAKHNGHAITPAPVFEFYRPRNDPFMPLEFSAAAFRFGPSMVRPGYRLSETVRPLAVSGPNLNQSLAGFREFPGHWAIDWNLFIDVSATF